MMGTFLRTCLAGLIAVPFLMDGFALAAPTPLQNPSEQRVKVTQGARTSVLASTKQVKYAPNRAEALRSQITLRDAENAIAQSVRKTAVPAVNPRATPSPRTVAVPASAISLTATRPRVDTTAGSMNTPPGIWFVNDKEKNFTLTPGGYVTIVGKGFGDGGGKVSMFVLAQGGRLEIVLPVSDWHDREIHAFVPAGIRGVADQSAPIQVTTRAGKAYSLDTGKFYAAREEITMNSGLGNVIRLVPSPAWSATLADDGRVDRVDDGGCGRPGTDRLYFKPQNGFIVSGIAWWTGREDTGDGDGNGHNGRREFRPGYSFGDWGTGSMAVGRDRSVQVPTLTLNWGARCVTRDSQSGVASFTATQGSSNYQIEVSLIGPAGVRPF